MSRRRVKYGSIDNPTLSDQVRAWRIARGMTQSELERRAGLAHNAVSRIERNDVSPRLDTVEKLAAAMELSVEELTFRQPSSRVREDSGDPAHDELELEALMSRMTKLPGPKRQHLARVISDLLDLAESE